MTALIGNPLLLTSAPADDAYQIEKGLRVAPSNYLRREFSSDGNRRTWTYAAWYKNSEIGALLKLFRAYKDDSNQGYLHIESDHKIAWDNRISGTWSTSTATAAKFRDPSAWFHITFVYDSNNTVEAERMRLFINGVRYNGTWEDAPNCAQYLESEFNRGGYKHDIASGNGYVADVHFIDGLALAPAAFGEFSDSNTWNPKAFALPAPNQNITWSNGLSHTIAGSAGTWTSPAVNAFNSDISSSVDEYQAVTETANGNQEIILTWVPPTALENVQQLRVSQYAAAYNYPIYTRINEEYWVEVDNKFPGWTENTDGVWMDFSQIIPSDRKITKIEWKRTPTTTGDGINLGVIEVNGVALVDGQIDADTFNNPNNGTKWSDQFTLNTGSYGTGEGPAGGFTGFTGTAGPGSDYDHVAPTHSNNSKCTWNTNIAFNTSFKFTTWCNKDSSNAIQPILKINDVNVAASVVNAGADGYANRKEIEFANHAGISSPITKIEFSSIQNVGASGNGNCGLSLLKVDGVPIIDELVDNTVHLKFNDTTTNAALGYDSLGTDFTESHVEKGGPILKTNIAGDTVTSSYNTDANKSNLVLALPGNTLTDVHHTVKGSGSAKSLTNDGVTVSTDDSKHYGSSLLFDSNRDDDLSITGDADFAFGTGDFCVEFWVKNKGNVNYHNYLATRSANAAEDGWCIATNSSGILYAHSNGAMAGSYSGEHTLPLDKWCHVAYTRASGTHRLFLNGVAAATASTTSRDYTNDDLTIGTNPWGPEPGTIYSYMQDIRIYKGAAKYTANFTPPTRNDFTAINLETTTYDTFAPAGPIYKTADKDDGFSDDSLKQYLRFACPCNEGDGTLDMNDYHATIKGSGSNHTITATGWTTHSASSTTGWGHSGDNNSNQATAQSSDFELTSTDDFCLEFWTYIPSSGLTTHARIFNFGDDSVNNIGAAVYSGGAVYPMVLGDYIITGGSGTNYTDNSFLDAWCHWAFTRDNGTCRIFQNGALKAEEANSGAMGASYNTMRISGANHQTEIRYHDIRYYIGTPKYTAAFTPSRVIGKVIQDALVDSPTNYGTDEQNGGEVRGNYCTLNPLAKGSNSSLSNGNLDYSSAGGSDDCCLPTMFMKTGKWYAEVTQGSKAKMNIGLAATDQDITKYVGQAGYQSYSYYSGNGNFYNGPGSSNAAYGNSWDTEGDVVGIAFDADNGTIWFHKNGTWQASATKAEIAAGTTTNAAKTGISMTKAWGICAGANDMAGSFNYGQRAWKYPDSVPSGFKAVCTQNLDNTFDSETSENNPSKYFDILNYTGTAAVNTIGGLNFQPELIWIKNHAASTSHSIYDTARGQGSNGYYRIESDTTDAQADEANLTAITSDGFTLTSAGGYTNGDGAKYTAWCWDAGTAAATASTDGSITPSAQWVNATAGFSICKYGGGGNSVSTVGHGLGVPPKFILVKNTGDADDWAVYLEPLGNTKDLCLNSNAAASTRTMWNDTSPNNTVFTLGAAPGSDYHNRVNKSGQTYIAYCWTPIAGYSAFGSYTGNESANGPMVNCGFRPRYVILKDTVNANNWYVYDSRRDSTNPIDEPLFPDGDYGHQGDDRPVDLVSNGFKIRNTSFFNANNDKIIWIAFAEHPFKTARAK